MSDKKETFDEWVKNRPKSHTEYKKVIDDQQAKIDELEKENKKLLAALKKAKETFEEFKKYIGLSYELNPEYVFDHQQAKINKLEQENKNFYDKLLECSSNFYRKTEENKNLLSALKMTYSMLTQDYKKETLYASEKWQAVENLIKESE